MWGPYRVLCFHGPSHLLNMADYAEEVFYIAWECGNPCPNFKLAHFMLGKHKLLQILADSCPKGVLGQFRFLHRDGFCAPGNCLGTNAFSSCRVKMIGGVAFCRFDAKDYFPMCPGRASGSRTQGSEIGSRMTLKQGS